MFLPDDAVQVIQKIRKHATERSSTGWKRSATRNTGEKLKAESKELNGRVTG